MRNLLLIIVLFVFGSFVNAQTLVSHNINNLTSGMFCGGYEFFASFDNTDDCNPTAGMPCSDVPHGVTNHDSRNQYGNQDLNGGTVLGSLASCNIPITGAGVNVYWTIDPVLNHIDIIIY